MIAGIKFKARIKVFDLGSLRPNLKNLSGGLNLSRGLNRVGST